VLAGLVAVLAAALNAENRVAAVTLSTIAFNLVMLLVLAWAFAGSEPLAASIWLAIAVVGAGLTQLVITGAVWLATGRRWQRVRARVPDRTPALFMRAGPGLIA